MLSVILLLGVLSNDLRDLQAMLPQTPKVYAETNIEASSPIQEWKAKLRNCESGGDDKALNPKDTDGTRSVGRYQFKDATFAHFSEEYKIPTTSVWNGDEQDTLLDQMIEHGVDLTHQFPACTRQIGLPEID